MRQIYSVFTYYQLITAIQIKTKCFPNDKADIVLSDHSNGYEKITENLQNEGIFDNVYTSKCVDKLKLNTFKKKMSRAKDILINNNQFARECSNIDNFYYDEFLFFNFNYFDSCLYYLLKKNNSKLTCRRFEEGYSSYFSSKMFVTGSVSMQRKFQILNRNPIFEKDIKSMFFYVPELALFDDYPKLKIPHIDKSDNKFREQLNRIFGYDYNNDEYSAKYIFFEESFHVDNRQMDDLELVQKIAGIVGKENLVVKLHPRSKVDRFTPYGIMTSKNSGIPWELMLLNENYSDKVFLTISSGSVLSPRVIFNLNIPTYMLFNCTSKKSFIVDDNFELYMRKFKSIFGNKEFYLPDNIDEFLTLLGKDNL